jgi:hypothetical protein
MNSTEVSSLAAHNTYMTVFGPDIECSLGLNGRLLGQALNVDARTIRQPAGFTIKERLGIQCLRAVAILAN